MLRMFTCLIDHVLTYVLALMIIFSHVYLLSWSYVSSFTYFDVHILLYSHALIITTLLCSHVFIIISPMSICFDKNISTCLCVLMLVCLNTFWLHAHMFICFVDHMLLCSHTSMIVCSHVYILCWSHVHLPVCLQTHMLGLIDDYLPLCWNALYIHMHYWSWAHICTCFDDNILTFLPAFMIICF